MVVIYVTGDSVSTTQGRQAGRTAKTLRPLYRANNDQFRAILVGKDGGAKLQASKPVPASRLFALIGSMPMR